MSYGHSGPTGWQCMPTRNHSDGMSRPRCGSLARREAPVADRDGATTKPFEPDIDAPPAAEEMSDRRRWSCDKSPSAIAEGMLVRIAVGVAALPEAGDWTMLGRLL